MKTELSQFHHAPLEKDGPGENGTDSKNNWIRPSSNPDRQELEEVHLGDNTNNSVMPY